MKKGNYTLTKNEEEILEKIIRDERCSEKSAEMRREELKSYRVISKELENTSIIQLIKKIEKLEKCKTEAFSLLEMTYCDRVKEELNERENILNGTTIPYIINKYEGWYKFEISENTLSDNFSFKLKKLKSIKQFGFKVDNWFTKIEILKKYLCDEYDFQEAKFFGHSEYTIYNDKKNLMISLAIITEIKYLKGKLYKGRLSIKSIFNLAEIMELLNELKFYVRHIICKDTSTVECYLEDIIENFYKLIEPDTSKKDSSLKSLLFSMISNVSYIGM